MQQLTRDPRFLIGILQLLNNEIVDGPCVVREAVVPRDHVVAGVVEVFRVDRQTDEVGGAVVLVLGGIPGLWIKAIMN